MLDTIFTGMSGLMGYSKGLQVIGNNLTNVNTPGFKGVNAEFGDMFAQQNQQGAAGGGSTAGMGTGLDTLATQINFQQGVLNQTGNPLDLAINGQGFFVLREGSDITYSRAGQFTFDKDGFLINGANNGQRVAGFDKVGQLADISLSSLQTNAAKASSSVKFTGNISSNATTDVTLGGISIFDPAGGTHTLSLVFHQGTPNNWTVTATDETGTTVGTGSLQFSNGNPVVTANAIQLTYSPRGVSPFALSLDFSSNVTSSSNGNTSTIAIASIDGNATGALTGATFDSTGTLVATYSNGATAKGQHLAIASFKSDQSISEVSGNQFVSKNPTDANYGQASTGMYGTISAGKIEGSNVDLSQEFSNLIVMQRGYQASSQVVSTANDMIQTLLDMKKQ
ncbi:flagellar hook protein FlgE [Undibacterium sp. TJN25]|uniref:flagellar hook protein FlgE n=1 Tax=Undibacterium sp. TJN25 TaxID=3413056 RepID=UPI003BF3039B